MTKEEREKAINKIMGYLATYLSVEQYAEAERIIKELRQDTVSRESYEHEYFLRKEFDFKIAKLEKAIKSLEQEPCEDIMTIHTQGLDEGIRCAMCTNSMKSDRGCDGGCMIDEDMYKKVMNIIRNRFVSSTTLTRKKGHWIMTSDYLTAAYETIDYVKCSCCGEESLEEGDWCPNCGAEMESEE